MLSPSRKVTEDSPAFIEQVVLGQLDSADVALADSSLVIGEFVRNLPADTDNALLKTLPKRVVKALSVSRQMLEECFAEAPGCELAFALKLLLDPRTRSELSETYRESGFPLAQVVADDFLNLPQIDFSRYYLRYVREFQRRAEIFHMVIPPLIEDFRVRIKGAISNGELPLTDNLVDQRLEGIQVTIEDSLEQFRTKNLGEFAKDESLVVLRDDLSLSDLRDTLFHELFHVLAGKTLQLHPGSFEDPPRVDHQRLGLWFSPKNRFEWLDEALTERLMLRFIQTPESDIYKEYRTVLDVLLQRVPERHFVAAYFENYDPSAAPGKRLPAWKALNEEITEKFGPGFLLAIDQAFKKGDRDELKTLLKGAKR